MSEKQAIILDQSSETIFADDTQKLGAYTSNYVQSFYPSYSVNIKNKGISFFILQSSFLSFFFFEIKG